jgi:aspartyl-tRNA(Asn)/glutamyl-tRNA(Gln) amidotransferase subunit A
MTHPEVRRPSGPPDQPADELLLAPVNQVRALLDNGSLSPRELTKAALERIERLDPQWGAFTHVAAESAMLAARESEVRLRNGRSRGRWDGIPVSVKDIVAVAGMPLEAGSAVLRGNVADRDATVVRMLRRAGAVVVGKTALDEFALTTTGPVRNPLNSALTAGGSSCGSAVAVRAGMSFADVATDTGGSARIPAHCCGVTGLKPTHGLLSLDGVIPLAHSLDHVATVARTPADTAWFLGSLAAGGPWGDRPRVRRIGVAPGLEITSSRVREEYKATVERLESSGAEIREVRLPDLDELAQAHLAILGLEMSRYHRDRFGSDQTGYGAAMETVLASGGAVDARSYFAAQEVRGALRRIVDRLFDDVDLLALPTLLVDVPAAGQDLVDVDGVERYATTAMVRLTSLFNHTGHPAMTVPLPGRRPGAMPEPASVQLVAPYFAEARLLRAADALVGSSVSGDRGPRNGTA